MLGTLIGALEVRHVPLEADAIRCDVEGRNELREGLPVLSEVRVHYTLRTPADLRDVVDRALAKHQDKCPTAATLAGAVRVSWTAEFVEG